MKKERRVVGFSVVARFCFVVPWARKGRGVGDDDGWMDGRGARRRKKNYAKNGPVDEEGGGAWSSCFYLGGV